MDKKKPFDIIGYGAVSVDDLLFVNHYPKSDSKTEVLHRERHGGGLTGTALVTAARLQTKTAYFGALGENELSEFTRKEFQNEKIDISKTLKVNEALPIYSTIIIDQNSGERTIFYFLHDFDPIDSNSIPANLCQQTSYLFLDTYVLQNFPALISMARQSNTPIIADVETDQVLAYPDELAAIDYLILNLSLASKITNAEEPSEILQRLDSPQRRCSVITQGDKGCWFKTKTPNIHYFPAYEVDVVDTTGCGDVFHGAFAAALVHGKDILEAVIWGSAAAAIKATQPGGRKGIPNLSLLLDFISARPQIEIRTLPQ